MKTLVALLLSLVVAASVQGATLVLKGGKRVEVASYEQQGTFVVVKLPGGTVQSYPASVVDMPATLAANKIQKATPPPVTEEPHSPFFRALSTPGTAAVAVTDADFKRPLGEESGGAEGEATPAATPAEDAAHVVLVSHDRKRLEDGSWEITGTVANQGTVEASNVSAAVRLLDADGKVIGSGTGTLSGTLAPGAQGNIVTHLAADGTPGQVSFELQWQSIRQTGQPKQVTKPAPKPAATAAPTSQ